MRVLSTFRCQRVLSLFRQVLVTTDHHYLFCLAADTRSISVFSAMRDAISKQVSASCCWREI